MRLLQTLRGRIVLASVLLALLIGAAFTFLIVSVRDARDAARVAERSERVSAAAHLLERLLLDLESGHRGYVITGSRAFLQAWDDARSRYPAAATQLRSLTVDAAQRRRVDHIHADLDAYVREWSQPIVDSAVRNREEAVRLVASGEGRNRVDLLRAQFDRFLNRQRALSQERSAEADRSETRAIVFGLGGLAASVLLVLLFSAYLIRSAIEPVEDVAGAARRLREGDRTARARERSGTDEASALTRDFNTMADELATSLDETARRRLELEAVLDSAVEGITMTDLEGQLVFSNDRMEALWRELGTGSGGTVWERLVRLAQLTPDAASYGPSFDALAADPEAVLEDDFDVPSQLRSFHGYTGPVRGPSGAVIGRLFSLRETTPERAAEQAKEQFLATVSHELRTPLTSILGFTEFVRDGGAGEITTEQRRFLDVVGRNARQLNVLVDDLLFVGRGGDGQLQLETSDIELAELARLAVDSMETDAAEKRVAVELDAPEPVVLDADLRRLTQLLHNLIGNAIKFTPNGGRVRVQVGADDGTARIEVEDTGPGIAEADQKHLFERFYRAATASGARVPGTGLGLAIVKAIVDAHGGAISVRSAPGEGSTFVVLLPGAET